MCDRTSTRIPSEWSTFKTFKQFNRFAPFKSFRRFNCFEPPIPLLPALARGRTKEGVERLEPFFDEVGQ